MKLSLENYKKGFLIDEEWMAGVSLDPISNNDGPQNGSSTAFILDHTLGETLFSETFPSLEAAISFLNNINRPSWKFETSSGCDSEECGKEGGSGCKGESCKIFSECNGTRC